MSWDSVHTGVKSTIEHSEVDAFIFKWHRIYNASLSKAVVAGVSVGKIH